MKNHWFYNRLLISYIPIIFSICTILVLLIVIGFNQLSREAAEKESMIIAKFIMTEIDHELVRVEKAIDEELLNKGKFMRLFQVRPTDSAYQDTYELSVMLRDITLSYPAIHSMYVFRQSDQTVQSMNGALSIDRFGDEYYVHHGIALANKDESPWSKIREFREFSSQNTTEVISLIRSIPIGQRMGGFVVVNISTPYLRDIVSHLTDLNHSLITIKDPEGNYLLEAGTDNVKVDAVYESQQSGYTIRLGFREGILHNMLNTITVIYVVLGMLVFILGLLWLIYTTRQTYKPVHAIMTKLDSFSSSVMQQFRKDKDNKSFGYVEQVLESLIEQSTQFGLQQKENATIRRRIFYTELREGSYKGSSIEVNKRLLEYGWDADIEGFMMAVVEIDGFVEFTQKFTERDQSLLKFAINNAIIEISQTNQHPQPWADWISGKQIALLYPIKGCGQSSQAIVTNDLNEAVGWIGNHLKTTVSIGIGCPVESAEQINKSYHEALHMLQFKFTLGNNRIIAHWEVERTDLSGHITMLGPTRELVRSFCQTKPDWQKQFDHWFDCLSNWTATKDDIDRLLYSLTYYIRIEISQLSGELSELWRREYDSQLEHCVQHGTSLYEIGWKLRELLTEVDSGFAEIRENKRYSTIMNELRQFIDAHYTDPALSLDLLSSRFDMNSKTLSRLFKEQFGINFVDYLIRTRIKQSKYLLLGTDDTIQSIASKVGYTNSLSFTRTFKKNEKITPQELRRVGTLDYQAPILQELHPLDG